MTDPEDLASPDTRKILQAIARSAGHELRNALNGLVVNLEVVRAQTMAARVQVEPFMGHAIAQSEDSIRLAEASIALMALFAGSAANVSSAGRSGRKREVCLEASGDGERVEMALQSLVARGVVSVERSGSTVILRLPEDRPESTGIE